MVNVQFVKGGPLDTRTARVAAHRRLQETICRTQVGGCTQARLKGRLIRGQFLPARCANNQTRTQYYASPHSWPRTSGQLKRGADLELVKLHRHGL